jgi:hypothetical protein
MLTLLEQINQKLPHVSELVLQEVWTILTTQEETSRAEQAPFAEDADLANEFAQWEAASDEDSEWMEEILTERQG